MVVVTTGDLLAFLFSPSSIVHRYFFFTMKAQHSLCRVLQPLLMKGDDGDGGVIGCSGEWRVASGAMHRPILGNEINGRNGSNSIEHLVSPSRQV